MTRSRKTAVCFISSYQMREYPRISTLKEALMKIRGVNLHLAQNTTQTVLRYAQTLLKTALIKIHHNPDYYIIAFRGHEIYWPIKLIAGNKTIIFDEFVSPFDSLVNERGGVKNDSFTAKLIFITEKSILASANKIITDTQTNAVYYSKLFSLPPNKFLPVYLGADDFFTQKTHNPRKNRIKPFNVFFYGTMLPLHGIDTIVRVIHSFRNHNGISFTIIGKPSKNFNPKSYKYLRTHRLKNLEYKDWVQYKRLKKLIQESDLCLGGPFGNTGQANRIITGKTFQFLKMGKPVVIGKNKETQKFFKHGKNAFLVRQGNAKDLLDTIKYCQKNSQLLDRVGLEGKRVYDKHFSLKHRISKIQELIRS